MKESCSIELAHLKEKKKKKKKEERKKAVWPSLRSCPKLFSVGKLKSTQLFFLEGGQSCC